MSNTEVVIGIWHEPDAREFTRCPSYYAADTETLAVVPGDYDARLTFQGGYTVPMPQWLLVRIATTRIEGRLYSGFGGHNFASTELAKGEAVTYGLQTYCYTVAEHVAAGRLTLKPGFEWLLGGPGVAVWRHQDAPKTWDDVAALRSAA